MKVLKRPRLSRSGKRPQNGGVGKRRVEKRRSLQIDLRNCGQISVCVLFHKLISNSVSVGNKTASCSGGGFDVLAIVTSGRNAQQWYAYDRTSVCGPSTVAAAAKRKSHKRICKWQ